MPEDTAFADELRAWRARCGLGQQEAAAFLNVAYRTYENWEQGRGRPSQIGPLRKLMGMMPLPGRRDDGRHGRSR